MSNVVYMFHAIGEIESKDWADPHYSYSMEKFKSLLDSFKKVSSFQYLVEKERDDLVIITFDDGHISNYQAAKYIYDNNLGAADFFINPEKVGSPYYMTWDQIKELDAWGMSIQSHGLDHQYLSDCDDVELHRQLLLSKKIIEEKIEKKVTLLAPPGGRYDDRVIRLSKSCGYSHILNSEPGHIANIQNILIPRMAVLNNHAVTDLISMRSKYSIRNLKSKAKYLALSIVKKLIGNTRYDRFRWYLMGEN